MVDIKHIKPDSDGSFPSYAWPGGYDIAYITDDGAVFCGACMNAEREQTTDPESAGTGWLVVAAESTDCWDEPGDCAHCGKCIGPERED